MPPIPHTGTELVWYISYCLVQYNIGNLDFTCDWVYPHHKPHYNLVGLSSWESESACTFFGKDFTIDLAFRSDLELSVDCDNKQPHLLSRRERRKKAAKAPEEEKKQPHLLFLYQKKILIITDLPLLETNIYWHHLNNPKTICLYYTRAPNLALWAYDSK